MYDDSITIGDPGHQLIYWEPQGQPDSCAVVAEMSIINQFGYDLTQDQATFISASNGWYHPGGGTSPSDIGNMMDMYGIPNHSCMDASISDLARELQAGHGVIVGVHSSELWDSGSLSNLMHFLCKSFGLDTATFNPADHAVVVTGIDTSDPANPMVIINDSGHPDGAGAAYPLDQFMDAWENSGFYYTATDGSLPVNDLENINALDFTKWIVGGTAAGIALYSTGDPATALETGIGAASLVDAFFSDPNAIAMI